MPIANLHPKIKDEQLAVMFSTKSSYFNTVNRM